LTGASRKEMAEAQAAAQTDERFRAALVDARNKGDEQELKRLDKARQLAAIAKKAGDEKGATGILQLAASGGAMSTDAAIAAQQTYGVNEILDSQGSVLDGVKELVKNGKISLESTAAVNKIIGNIPGLQTGVVGQADLLDLLQPAIAAAEKQGISLEQALQQQQDKRAKTTNDKGDLTDTAKAVDAGRLQQSAALIIDKSAKELTHASDIYLTASKIFHNGAEMIARKAGVNTDSSKIADSKRVNQTEAEAKKQKEVDDAKAKGQGQNTIAQDVSNVGTLAMAGGAILSTLGFLASLTGIGAAAGVPMMAAGGALFSEGWHHGCPPRTARGLRIALFK
jgi:hypothetical protein